MNRLSVGDRITASVAEGVRDWIEAADGLQLEYEIVGIYTTTRSEPATPAMKECDRQENMIFTDIHSAKQLFSARFPHRSPQEYTYSSGIMLFLDDPAEMAAVIERMRREASADWDGLLVFENSAAYRQAVAPSFAVSLLLGALISGNVRGLLDGVPRELRVAPPQAAVVLLCSAAVVFITVLLAGLSILRRKPKAILTDLG